MKGKFIVFDGCDFTGKSTQIKQTSDYLHKKNIRHIITREPGGSPIGEEIRKIVLQEGKKIHSKTEFLLFIASRAEHLYAKIIPAINSGTWVICDRFLPSTFVYQGILRGIDKNLIIKTHKELFDDLKPDLTLIFDMEPQDILERMAKNHLRGLNAYDAQTLEEITKIRSGFIEFTKTMDGYTIINANQNEEKVFTDIISSLI